MSVWWDLPSRMRVMSWWDFRVEPVMVVEKSRVFAKHTVRRCVPRGRSTGRERERAFIWSNPGSLSFTRGREKKSQIYCSYRSSQRSVSAVQQRSREVLPHRGSAASKTAWGASARNSKTLIPQQNSILKIQTYYILAPILYIPIK